MAGFGYFAGGLSSGLNSGLDEYVRIAQARQQQQYQQLQMQQLRQQMADAARARQAAGMAAGVRSIPGLGQPSPAPGPGPSDTPTAVPRDPAPAFAPQPGQPSQAAAQPEPQQPTFGQPLDDADFDQAMDRAFGKGNWSQTSGYRTQAAEDRLRAEGAPAVAAGKTSAHTTGSPAAPGARDIVVKGMSPQAAAAKLVAMGFRFRQVLPEGSYKTADGKLHSAHLHIDSELGSVAEPDRGPQAGASPSTPDDTAQAAPAAPGAPTGLGGASGADAFTPDRLAMMRGQIIDAIRSKNPDADAETVGEAANDFVESLSKIAQLQRLPAQIIEREATTAEHAREHDTPSGSAVLGHEDRQAGLQEREKEFAARQKLAHERMAQSQSQFDKRESDINARLKATMGGQWQRSTYGQSAANLRSKRGQIISRMNAYEKNKGAGLDYANDPQWKAMQAQLDTIDAQQRNLANTVGAGPVNALPAGVHSVEAVP